MNEHLKKLKEIMESDDNSYEDIPSDVYSHKEYITGFPYFLEDIVHFILKDVYKPTEEQLTEARYLVLKHKEDIDINFQKLMFKIKLDEELFRGIKDIENFKDYM
jgi:hypothetical protein